MTSDAAPFVGAITLEIIHWYELRERLNQPRYRRLLRSTGYWVATTLMIVAGGVAMLIIDSSEHLNAVELLVGGAAFPTLLKKLIAAFVTKQTLLGGEVDDASLRSYFSID